MTEYTPFTDSQYSLLNLMSDLQTNENPFRKGPYVLASIGIFQILRIYHQVNSWKRYRHAMKCD